MGDVRLDPIVSLREVPSSREFVYDLTVATTRNMCATHGLGLADTFHHSGIASKGMQGVPRLKEIIDASHFPKMPVTTLWLRAPLCYDASFAARFARTLPRVTLGKLVEHVDILHEPDPARTEVESDRVAVEMDAHFCSPPPGASEYVARCALRKDDMRARDLTPPHLHHLLSSRLGCQAHVVSSEANSLEWVIRLRFHHVASMARVASSSSSSSDGLEASLVRRVTTMLLDQVVVGGIEGVTGAQEREVSAWNAEEERDEPVHVVDVMGSALAVACLLPVVDAHRSTSTDPHEVARCLGIEAAMATIHHEIDSVISFDSSKVEKRHVQLVADAMTHRGAIIPMSRHGLNRPGNTSGALVQASFEETSDVLMEAATFGKTDPAQGVTYSVMSGEESTIVGTGAFDVLVPEAAVAGRARTSDRPSRRLAKSTVHYAVEAPPDERTVVGYVDKSLWCFDGADVDATMHPPYAEGGEEGGEGGLQMLDGGREGGKGEEGGGKEEGGSQSSHDAASSSSDPVGAPQRDGLATYEVGVDAPDAPPPPSYVPSSPKL